MAARIVTRPTGHRHDLVENLALVLLAGPRIRLRVPGGDLGTRLHRQPISHAPTASPFRGHSYVRHGERFAGSFRESRRRLPRPHLQPDNAMARHHSREWVLRGNWARRRP